MATGTTEATMVEAKRLTRGVVKVMEKLKDEDRVFAADAFFDINVPSWRFQIQGPVAFMDWFREYCPDGYRIAPRQPLLATNGFVFELEGEYVDHNGVELFFRNLFVCKVEIGQITEVSYWCTGDWDPETREHHRAEVNLLRP